MSSFPQSRQSLSPQDRTPSASDASTLRLPPILPQDARQQDQSATVLPGISALDVTDSALHGDSRYPAASSLIEHAHPLSLRPAAGQLGPDPLRNPNPKFQARQERHPPQQTTQTSSGSPWGNAVPANTHETTASFTRPHLPLHVLTDSPRPVAPIPRTDRPSDSPERLRQTSEASSVARDYASLSISSTSRSSLSYSATSASSAIQSSIADVSPGSLSWNLIVRQQPMAARACGYGERDRRVIDPPPIVELAPSDGQSSSTTLVPRNRLCVVHVSLFDEDGTTDCTSMDQPGRRAGGRLMGTLVASGALGKDERGQPGIFFAFPDLSCRSYGRYRLRFSLMLIDTLAATPGSTSPITSNVMSEVFEVFSAKEFPGMIASTPLTHALRRQGVNIPAKKGKQSRTSKDSPEDDSEEDDENTQRPTEPSAKGKGPARR